MLATTRKGKIEETPGYCKAEDLANLFALTGQWINQLTRDGVLKKRDTPAGKRYNVVESTRAYVQYIYDKAHLIPVFARDRWTFTVCFLLFFPFTAS